ncbi:serine acetyltransferase [Saccharophagus degradans]|uniref:Serine acetyltransferase n=1 Tax=Saccharophagus degradans TaxID=86304 RepID=A0AAW7X3D7_9GAMM|nr:serine acetyltransferase [Saccharophagus degradans]MDO6421062.1 serine acetyltransferase [Saccharophagus degradans]MDO6606027.1 serine acetyltransferase [Saccharophagus degradans]
MDVKKIFFEYFFSPSRRLKRIYFRACRYEKLPAPFRYLRELPRRRIVDLFSCYLSPKASLHESVYFPHPVGIVIGDGVRVGKGCIIYQNVTLGAARKGEGHQGLYPEVGENVIIYAGAVIVGGVTIGDNSVIGANAVVNVSVPAGSLAVGVPVKIKAI